MVLFSGRRIARSEPPLWGGGGLVAVRDCVFVCLYVPVRELGLYM